MKLRSFFKKMWGRSPEYNVNAFWRAAARRKNIEGYEQLIDFPRYTVTDVKFFGKQIRIVDSASFLFMYRELFELEIYKFITQKKNPHIVDCGANIGLSIIYFKRLYPDAEIIAFEPDEDIFHTLQHNVRVFGFSNVSLIKKGVWNKEGNLHFWAEGADGGHITFDLDKKSVVEIQTSRLRGYLQSQVDFLKIDIEGAETEVLEDCKDLLGNVKNLFVEYHSFLGRPQTLSTILEILNQAGFRYHIQHIGIVSPHPFCEQRAYADMDMQLNIFAYRN